MVGQDFAIIPDYPIESWFDDCWTFRIWKINCLASFAQGSWTSWRHWRYFGLLSFNVWYLDLVTLFVSAETVTKPHNVAKFNALYLWFDCQLCVYYLPQWWVEFKFELSWLFTNRFNQWFLSYLQKIAKSFPKFFLNFIYLLALNLWVNNQLNSSSNSTHHCIT